MSIFVVLKNADFTEGRGPMLFDKAFKYEEDAVKYIMSQKGIYGSTQGIARALSTSRKIYNGFEIIEVPLYDSYDDFEDMVNQNKAKDKIKELQRQIELLKNGNYELL